MVLGGPQRKRLSELMLQSFPEYFLIERLLTESERPFPPTFTSSTRAMDQVVFDVIENVPHHALLKIILSSDETSPALRTFCAENLRDTDPAALEGRLNTWSTGDLEDVAKKLELHWQYESEGNGKSIVAAAKAAGRLEDLADQVSVSEDGIQQLSLQEQLQAELGRKVNIRVDDLPPVVVAEMLQTVEAAVNKVLDANIDNSRLVLLARRLQQRVLKPKGGNPEKLATAALWVGAVLNTNTERAALENTLGPVEKTWKRVTARRIPLWGKVAAGVVASVALLFGYAYFNRPPGYTGRAPSPTKQPDRWVWTGPEATKPVLTKNPSTKLWEVNMSAAPQGGRYQLSPDELNGKRLYDFDFEYRIRCSREVEEIGWDLIFGKGDSCRFRIAVPASSEKATQEGMLEVTTESDDLIMRESASFSPKYRPGIDSIAIRLVNRVSKVPEVLGTSTLQLKLSLDDPSCDEKEVDRACSEGKQDHPECKAAEKKFQGCDANSEDRTTPRCWEFYTSNYTVPVRSIALVAPVGAGAIASLKEGHLDGSVNSDAFVRSLGLRQFGRQLRSLFGSGPLARSVVKKAANTVCDDLD